MSSLQLETTTGKVQLMLFVDSAQLFIKTQTYAQTREESMVIPLEPVSSGLMASPLSHGSIGFGVLNMAMPISKHTFTPDFMTLFTGAFL